MQSLNKAGLLGSALIALLIITSCSDSGTSTTGVAPLSRDAAEGGAINNATLKKEGDHDHGPQGHESTGVANPGQGEGLGHQHGEPREIITTTTVLALAAIPASRCGNAIQESGEQCDDGPSGSATCTANCTLKEGKGGEIVAERFCGDGVRVVSLGEQCDDGNNNNNDSCTNSCKKAICGDGYTQSANGEQCDDKNKVDTDSCNNSCQKPDSTTTVTTTEETTTTTEDGNTRVTTIATDPDGNITTTDGPPLSCEDTCAALHSTEASYVPCKDKCDSGSSSSPPPALCRDEVTTVDDGCVCTNFNETDPNRTSSLYRPIPGKWSSGSILTFGCLEGYVLDGNQTMTCTDRGFWSPDKPPACTLSAEGECENEGGTWYAHDHWCEEEVASPFAAYNDCTRRAEDMWNVCRGSGGSGGSCELAAEAVFNACMVAAGVWGL